MIPRHSCDIAGNINDSCSGQSVERAASEAPGLKTITMRRCMDDLDDCRYVPGQHFGKHVDDSVEASPGHWTKYTLLIYLSDASNGLIGGETAFFGPSYCDIHLLRPAEYG